MADLRKLTKSLKMGDEFYRKSHLTTKASKINNHLQKSAHQRKQLSSFILFTSVVIFVNLCPFHPELALLETMTSAHLSTTQQHLIKEATPEATSYIENCLRIFKLVFTNPVNFNKMRDRRLSSFAEAKIIGKMAKFWIIKKKLKKVSKKLLKKQAIVPVLTIPIYEHVYYPQPHVTHVSHAGLHHAGSSYAPAVSSGSGQQIAASSYVHGVSQPASQPALATSASSYHQHIVPYRPMPTGHLYHHHPGSPMASQIINDYVPSRPTYNDAADGLYGYYNNAYSPRGENGGYHVWL